MATTSGNRSKVADFFRVVCSAKRREELDNDRFERWNRGTEDADKAFQAGIDPKAKKTKVEDC